MRRGRGLMVVAVLSMLALAGCTGGSEDPPTTPAVTSAAPPPSETPSTTPTPDAATPPERPDMSQVDNASAQAAAMYFLELYPYVLATGDLTEWDALSHPECIFCASVRQGALDLQAEGQHSTGGLVTFDNPGTTETSNDMWLVQFRMVQAPSATVDAVGTIAQTSTDTTTYDVAVAVAADAGRLLVREVTPTRVG